MAVSSERLVNGLRDRGHAVMVVHLSESSVPDGGAMMAAMAGIKASTEPESLFWALRKKMEGSVFVGFGADRAGYLAVLWALWLGAKSLVLLRGNDFDRIIHNHKTAWLTHFILEKASVAGTVSREMLARVSALRSGLSVYTPNGIDISEWVTLDSDVKRAEEIRKSLGLGDKKVAGIFGHLKYKKGLDAAADIFSNFGLGAGAYLMAVGTIPEGVVACCSLEDKEFWIDAGYKDRDELPPWYILSDVVLIPSYYDGMPNVLIEAMSLGRVVAANARGAMPDLIEDGVNGFLFNTGNPLEAASVIRKAISLDEVQRRIMGKKARETIERGFTTGHETDAIESALSHCLT
jgi:glycogen(starch) synthase